MRHTTNRLPAEPVTEIGTDRDPVEALAEEFLQRRRQGADVSVTDYVQKYPQWSQRIRELFSTLLLVEDMKTVQRQSTGRASGSEPACLSEESISRLGDFRVTREIGRGGMGIVYEAVQESLGRRVALKVVSQGALGSPQALQRFRREAQAAARLHHTNIVPVFGVGEEDGRNYYVMQYIEGCSLDCMLDELTAGSQLTTVVRLGRRSSSLERAPGSFESDAQPKTSERRDDTGHVANQRLPSLEASGAHWRNVASIGAQAADALQYAHEAGVLHRDVKPGNLLLDSNGVVWITDFGLAKVVEQGDMTRTGDMVGTLRYMAPEQLDREADGRCDVYALGLTLYELATRRPAFDETSRHRLMKQVLHQDPPPPRAVNPGIPRDLETVILKAITREPAHRYQTAGAMRDDLRRFLQDQPVAARRVTAVERLWRWCRRNPVTAGLTSALFALLIGITAVVFLGAMRVNRALESETRQRERAETSCALAFQVLDRIYAQLAPDRGTDDSQSVLHDADGEELALPQQPLVSKESAALLENLLDFYDRLAEQAGDDPELLLRVADANRRVGDIQARLGHHDQARDALLRSVALYQALQEQSPDDKQIAVEMARVHNQLGSVYAAMRQMDKARNAHQDALELLTLNRVDTASAKHRFELARTQYFLGVRHRPSPNRRVANSAPSGSGSPKTGTHGFWGGAPGRFPWGPSTQFDRTVRQQHLQQAVDLLQELLEVSPEAAEYRCLLARCYRAMAIHSIGSQKRQSSPVTLAHAAEILQALVDEFPDVADYRYELCQIYAMPGYWWSGVNGDVRAASEERLQIALKLSERLVAEHPHVPDYASLRTQILSQHAEAMRWTGRRIRAEASFREALAVQSLLVEQFPDVARFRLSQARLQKSLAEVLKGQKKLTEARSLLEHSVKTLSELNEHETAAPFARLSISGHYAALADVLDDLGEKEAADKARSHVVKFRGPGPSGPRTPTSSAPTPGVVRPDSLPLSPTSQ